MFLDNHENVIRVVVTTCIIIVARVMFEDVGIEKTKQWLNQDMLGCLNKFFQLCNTSDFLKDREVR